MCYYSYLVGLSSLSIGVIDAGAAELHVKWFLELTNYQENFAVLAVGTEGVGRRKKICTMSQARLTIALLS